MSENSEKWCDLCLHRRKCQSIDSGIRVGTKPCFVNICQWCRGVETRRNGAKSHGNGPPRADDDTRAVETPPTDAGRLNRLELDP
jgi:hypothetical protein